MLTFTLHTAEYTKFRTSVYAYYSNLVILCWMQEAGSLEETPLTIVTTLEQLEQLKQELMNVKEFAIDLEVHCVYA